MRLVSLRLLIMLGGALMTLQACSLLSLKEQSLPVSANQLGEGLPLGYEVHAALTVEREGVRREFLMALRSGLDQVRLALMTPQGLPVYVVTASKEAIAIRKQLRLKYLLTPDMVVRYILMMYGSNEFLHQASAGTDWQVNVTTAGRHFFKMDTAEESIIVTFWGKSPWYKEVKLTNSWDDTRVTVRTLESFDVVSK